MLRTLALAALTLATPALGQDSPFPVTVAHSLGEVTIFEEPHRIVALIDRDADTLLALGVQPVAIRSNYNFDTGVGPWAEMLLTTTPEVWTGRELNYEAIAATEPDLIVFAFSGGDPAEYEMLSQIAPTVALPQGATPWGATTEQTTLLIAEALGRRDDGQALLDGMQAHLAAIAETHPEFADHTATYLDIFPGGIWAYGQDQIVNQVLYAIGFEPAPGTLAVPDGAPNVDVSAELLAEQDADIVLAFPYGRTMDELVAETPTIGTLDSVRAGNFILLDSLAFSTASVLSIPHAVDALTPQFAAALAD